MRRKIVLALLFLIIAFALKPVTVNEFQPLLLPPMSLDEDQKVSLTENNPTDFESKNSSFERLYYTNDEFSDTHGFRPFPWGKEIFEGNPHFKMDSTIAKSGNWSFQITSTSPDNVGAFAVPGFIYKPSVKPGKIYYLSFWINYDFEKGKGIRVFQQFFVEGDYKFPSYASYGPFITGSSDGEWEKVGLLVKAPPGSIRGDPVLLMAGEGRVNIDDAYFGEVQID